MIYLDRGYIGYFEMSDKATGRKQLELYVSQLKNAGHKRIVAPIDGDTWHRYRLVSWSNDEPEFPLEPRNPLWYNEVFEECGFMPLKKYSSYKFCVEDIKSLPDINSNIRLRSYHIGDLKTIYDVSSQGFDENFLYGDITFEEFNKLYLPILPVIDEELVIIAEVGNVPIGFLFSFPIGDKLILKTIAVIPRLRSCGIGAKMITHALLTGQRKRLKTAIAALIADDNNSHRLISKYGGEKIREYTLYYLSI